MCIGGILAAMYDAVYILQPPVVQLNGPYPAAAYLVSFLRSLQASGRTDVLPAAGIPAPGVVRALDLNHALYRRIFSRDGLTHIFDACAGSISGMAASGRSGSGYTEAVRFWSERRAWIEWIDCITRVLSGSDRERSHALVRSPAAPRGPRMDAWFSAQESEPGADDARLLATLALEDLADFITACFDSEFSLVRYAESLAASERSFDRVLSGIDRPLVRNFIEPLAAELLAPDRLLAEETGGRVLFGLSVPFPGCVVPALAISRTIRRLWGPRAVIAWGSGYVNTELRTCDTPALQAFCDHLCLDRGYGALASLLRADADRAALPFRLSCPDDLAELEEWATGNLVPDYSDLCLADYPRLADTHNPMHRLWSDGVWLKAYLAHGCYWHRCSFCDVTLDYISAYRPVRTGRLYQGLLAQAEDQGVYGIHFVDEAAPPRALRDFALANMGITSAGPAAAGQLSFWGNIRFEKTFDRDLADLLVAGGLAAVSGGIEIASPEGFKAVDKGIDLENLVATCAAFKEAGVLVHSYLIYGYWNETARDVIDSAEVMRQLFAAGLVDSAFWHKFVLTRHSRVYREWQDGMHPSLRPLDSCGDFADNDLRFSGEDASARYTGPLDAALAAWMSGEDLDRPVRGWFPFAMPEPRIEPDLIDGYIAAYETRRDAARKAPCDNKKSYLWLAGQPVYLQAEGEVLWWYRGEEIRVALAASQAHVLCGALTGSERLIPGSALAGLDSRLFTVLRSSGLVPV